MKITTLVIAMTLGCVSSVAFAEDIQNSAKKSNLQVGIGGIVGDKGFRNYDTDSMLIPAVSYDNGKVFFRDNQLGMNVIKDSQQNLKVL
ncbi:hypothetical protein ACGTJS_12100 [Faucicola mancuniensis]|uniref:hypothetical protein n=1 Tax=Faucicola mancuniensis TaxID=1309795 RepID=UPI00397752F0